MSELLFCTFYVFAKLVMKAVLSLADGGREKWNPLLLFYRSAKLSVSLGAKYSNWENCASDCINSLLQFHLNPLKSHRPSVHDRPEPRVVSERAGRCPQPGTGSAARPCLGCEGMRDDDI